MSLQKRRVFAAAFEARRHAVIAARLCNQRKLRLIGAAPGRPASRRAAGDPIVFGRIFVGRIAFKIAVRQKIRRLVLLQPLPGAHHFAQFDSGQLRPELSGDFAGFFRLARGVKIQNFQDARRGAGFECGDIADLEITVFAQSFDCGQAAQTFAEQILPFHRHRPELLALLAQAHDFAHFVQVSLRFGFGTERLGD